MTGKLILRRVAKVKLTRNKNRVSALIRVQDLSLKRYRGRSVDVTITLKPTKRR